MPTPDKRHINIAPVTWTPSGGSLVTWTGVSGLSINPNAEIQEFDADADVLPTMQAYTFSSPSLQLTMANLAAQIAAWVGARGIFTATIQAALQKLTTGGGAILVTFGSSGNPATIVDQQVNATHRNFASGTVSLKGESADGSTPFMTFTFP